jgi:hypothetical protein
MGSSLSCSENKLITIRCMLYLFFNGQKMDKVVIPLQTSVAFLLPVVCHHLHLQFYQELENTDSKWHILCVVRTDRMDVKKVFSMLSLFQIRWVVESANARIKNFKWLDRVLPTNQVPFIGDYVRIVCAISYAMIYFVFNDLRLFFSFFLLMLAISLLNFLCVYVSCS